MTLDHVGPSEDFEAAVNAALDVQNPRNELENIANQYESFYGKRILLSGRLMRLEKKQVLTTGPLRATWDTRTVANNFLQPENEIRSGKDEQSTRSPWRKTPTWKIY